MSFLLKCILLASYIVGAGDVVHFNFPHFLSGLMIKYICNRETEQAYLSGKRDIRDLLFRILF